MKGKLLKKSIAILLTAATVFSSVGTVSAEDLFSSEAPEIAIEQELNASEEELTQEESVQAFEAEAAPEAFTEGDPIEGNFTEEIPTEEFTTEVPAEESFTDDISAELNDEKQSAGALTSSGKKETNVKAAYGAGSGTPGVKLICDTYDNSNVEYQDYSHYNWSATNASYLEKCADGKLMRVQAGAIKSKILVEYYDKSYNFISKKIIGMELPIWGDFYSFGGYYYVVTGKKNEQELDSAEVIRITKYSTSWKRLGSASLYGANTNTPFDAGSLRMAGKGSLLFIHTSHLMYGGHQANMKITVNVDDMSIVHSNTDVSNYSTGYVSHSFNQFIKVDGNDVISVDHGDAYPRAVALFRSESAAVTGNTSENISLYAALTYPGVIGQNFTGASVGALEISSSSYLVAGTQIARYEMEDYYYLDHERNVFVTSINKTTGEAKLTYLTDYLNKNVQATTPHMVAIGDDRFMVLWSHYEKDTVCYTIIDGTGKRISDYYTMKGNLSDCVPQLIDGKLVWFTWDYNINVFYEISLSNMKPKTIVLENGHQYVGKGKIKDYFRTIECSRCGKQEKRAVPMRLSELRIPNTLYVGQEELEIVDAWAMNEGDYDELNVTISDPEVLSYRRNRGIECYGERAGEILKYTGYYYYISALKPGTATITVQAKYNPSVKVEKTITVTLGKPDLTSVANTASGISLKWKKSKVATGYYVYRKTGTGSYKRIATIKNKNTVSYVDKSVSKGGEYTYNIRAYYGNVSEKGNYIKTYRLTAPSLTVKSTASKTAVLNWKKATNGAYYQYQFSTRSDFKNAKYNNVTKNTTLSKKVTGLKSGTTYYFRLRTYKKISGRTCVSQWTTKKIKVK